MEGQKTIVWKQLWFNRKLSQKCFNVEFTARIIWLQLSTINEVNSQFWQRFELKGDLGFSPRKCFAAALKTVGEILHETRVQQNEWFPFILPSGGLKEGVCVDTAFHWQQWIGSKLAEFEILNSPKNRRLLFFFCWSAVLVVCSIEAKNPTPNVCRIIYY